RAELLLADRAAVWKARPENRQLPSLGQWLQIRWLTPKKGWTAPQRKMMGQAGRYHVLRGLVVAGGVVRGPRGGWGGRGPVVGAGLAGQPAAGADRRGAGGRHGHEVVPPLAR